MKKTLVCTLVLLAALLAASNALALSKGDTVAFGTYPQTVGGGQAPLRWLVLDVQGDEALLITEQVIDAMDYGSKNPLYWENSDLRKWANGAFISTAFTAGERAALVITRVVDSDDRGKQTVTQDYVFILDAEEAERYFSSDSARQSAPTQYARGKNVRVSGGAWYWLRSKSDMYKLFGDVFSYVDTDGSVYIRGATAKRANKENMGVRPVCRVKVSALDGTSSGAADPVREAVTFSTKSPGQAKRTPTPKRTATPKINSNGLSDAIVFKSKMMQSISDQLSSATQMTTTSGNRAVLAALLSLEYTNQVNSPYIDFTKPILVGKKDAIAAVAFCVGEYYVLVMYQAHPLYTAYFYLDTNSPSLVEATMSLTNDQYWKVSLSEYNVKMALLIKELENQ